MSRRPARRARRIPAGSCRALGAGLAALTVAALAGCGVPVDPDGSLERITGHELRVGASPSSDLVIVAGADVEGPLPELIEGFAEQRDAAVLWTIDSEEDLVQELVDGRIDLAIGGMTAATPWSAQVSVTRGYPRIPGSHGADVAVLLPLGENGLQAALEAYLDDEVGG